MRVSFGIKQAAISGGIFAALLFALVSIDPHVQDRFYELVAGQGTVSSFTDRASMLGGALMSAVRYQSLENAPMVVFATAGAVLFLFMVRT
jgi:hypothetical protein